MNLDFPLPHDPSPPPCEIVWSQFLAVLDALTPRTRAAFMLHVLFGASPEDIARLLGLPARECRDRIEFARRRAHEHARLLARTAGTP
jgi:DNA-directed RNA polymerase specialized sigma24 family protein